MKKSISFEDKLEELKRTVEDLEKGNISLKESMEKYQISLELIKQCYEELNNAELKIEKITKQDGKIVNESLTDKIIE